MNCFRSDLSRFSRTLSWGAALGAFLYLGHPAAIFAKSDVFKDPYFEIRTVQIQELTSEPSPLGSSDFQSLPQLPSTSLKPQRLIDLSPMLITPTPTPAEAPSADAPTPNRGSGTLDQVDAVLDQIINIGRKVWVIVENNRPVVELTHAAAASALPSGVEGWQSLENWQTPRVRTFKVTYTNGFGFNVVEFTYRLTYTPGGQLNGKGRYLSEINVEPGELSVLWGFTFKATSSVPAVLNTGTREAPVAGAHVVVAWSVDSPLKTMRESHRFFVQGSGVLTSLVR
jgi:hypothetical protein